MNGFDEKINSVFDGSVEQLAPATENVTESVEPNKVEPKEALVEVIKMGDKIIVKNDHEHSPEFGSDVKNEIIAAVNSVLRNIVIDNPEILRSIPWSKALVIQFGYKFHCTPEVIIKLQNKD